MEREGERGREEGGERERERRQTAERAMSHGVSEPVCAC